VYTNETCKGPLHKEVNIIFRRHNACFVTRMGWTQEIMEIIMKGVEQQEVTTLVSSPTCDLNAAPRRNHTHDFRVIQVRIYGHKLYIKSLSDIFCINVKFLWTYFTTYCRIQEVSSLQRNVLLPRCRTTPCRLSPTA
jgi:hypothetical protein